MDYRAVRPEEVPAWRAFEEYCFRVSPAEFEPWMTHSFRLETARGLFGADGELLAALALYPFDLYMEGVTIRMGGIASVASVPENRRGGYVARALELALAEMKERAMPLSGLYPFKQSFYRRFGWDVAAAWLEHKIPVELLGGFRKAAGVIKRFLPGEAPLDQIKPVYAAWAAPQRGRMVRESDWHWHRFINGSHGHWRQFTATWHPEPGAAPAGYVVYRFDQDSLVVKEIVALTLAAERALLGYLANHDSQVKHVVLRTARDYPIWHLVENTSEVEMKLSSGWQLRLVDIKAAFESRPWTEGVQGSFTFQVADEHAPWNEGTWQVAFDGGRAEVQPAPGAVADLSAGVHTWAQLFAGFVSPEGARASGRLEVSDHAAMRVFADAVRGPGMNFFEYF